MTDNADRRDGTTPIGPGRPSPPPPVSPGKHDRRRIGWSFKLGVTLAVTLAATVIVATVVDRDHGGDDSETPPTTTEPSPPTGDTNSGVTADRGAAVFADNCARCHGDDGGGGVGPQLSAGRVVTRYPNIDDQIAFFTTTHSNITEAGNLSPEAIRAVVEYTRSL